MTAQISIADEYRQHDAHEHGAAMLGLAQEGNTLQIELDSPAFNILGFEYAPGTAEEKETLVSAINVLNSGERLFSFPKSAKCSLVDSDVHSNLLESELDDEHEAHDDHDHDEVHDEHKGHSDLEVVWSFNCLSPDDLKEIEITLFSEFKNLTDLDVDYITNTGQGSVELSPSNNVISF
jgi:hypothetical protein